MNALRVSENIALTEADRLHVSGGQRRILRMNCTEKITFRSAPASALAGQITAFVPPLLTIGKSWVTTALRGMLLIFCSGLSV